MSHFSPVIVSREGYPIIGMKILTTIQATIEQSTIKRLEATFFKRSIEIQNRVGTSKILVQIYPANGYFGYHVPYTVILGYRVENLDTIPAGMVGYHIPAGEYAKITHVGSEEWITKTYEFIYRHWLPRKRRTGRTYDYEVWDRRYQPGQPHSEIDIFVPMQPNRSTVW